ncbi:MAG: polyribonucleotide nucleotidyltransferase [Actinomycetota bacterium]|jgi:polyribonucleotide nucleotidyltransferase|nr:polyribonucleotide nucleotidyltransferase [Acidimicrobiales bacterium]MEC8977004.1 polyribonucleotide nucleotidyltransferase [Actinomycetota bacterium]MED5173188.1 polyribonucleotide nucleotidyltransferase [Actinomycetota bacterium]|tara:strand:- start:241 stop:2673 length:2433 start_codon:yes stop_codon:yes gene_type:complete
MADAISVSGPISGTDKTISFETGKLAGLSNGAVIAKIGSTQVLVTATASSKPRDGADFFPLTVDIEERMYAAGRIPGSFFRREGRASDDAILACRLIDRPLRPNFPSEYRHDTHVVGTILGVDGENPYDVIALNGASAALWVSGIPFESPIAAVRIAYNTEGSWIPFPTYQEGEAATFEMVVAGRQLQSGDIAIMMVEAGGTERAFEYYDDGAPKVTEEVLADGLEASKQWIDDVIELQKGLRSQLGDIEELEWTPSLDYNDEILARVRSVATPQLTEVMAIADKAEREARQDAASAEIQTQLEEEFAETTDASKQIRAAVRSVSKEIVRRRIVEDGFRIDGRATDEVRPLSAEVSYIGETAHGSGLFQRGETQVLNVTTLGMSRMEQLIDTLNPNDRKRYMHHYNFPPFSTGEAGFMRGPKRREIGHGALAERALLPAIPSKESFPYTLRLVSDVLSSNGSTSMGSVCASSLSLMDAGVPIRGHVSGIAMGLVHADGKYVTLTDILGAEDAFGDMDFKIAGTEDAITALQLDTKIEGIPAEVLTEALAQARSARMQILAVMNEAIPEPRPDVGGNAPKIVSFEIPIDKIGEVIGPRGKVINTVQEETGADISVDDDGTVGVVSIGSPDRDRVVEAERQIRLIVNPPTADVGAEYDGRVVNITKFGAFVNILPGTDGLLHISKIGGKRRLDKVEEVLNVGDAVKVLVDDIDPNGKLSLSMVADAEAGSVDDTDEPIGESEGGQVTAETRQSMETSDSTETSPEDENGSSNAREYVSFEEHFSGMAEDVYGDMGPEPKDDGRGRRRRRGRR